MRNAVLTILLFSSLAVQAQSPQKYWIQFSDKDNTPYSLSQPLEFLSQRALDRRERQNIPLKENDLPVDPAYIQAVLNTGATYLTHSKWFNSVSVEVPDQNVLNAILALPFVVDSNAVGKQESPAIPIVKWEEAGADKNLQLNFYEESDYGMAFNQIDMLGGVTLHNLGYRGQGMRIAVLDAGFPNVDVLPAFDSLRNEGRLIGGWDFVARNGDIFGDDTHGQLVLSTMAGILPGEFMGTAPKAEYLLLRTEDGATESPIELDYWIAGAEYADSAGADVINSSLGYTTFDNPLFDFTYSDMDGNTTRGTRGADLAASKGILVVNSAGNSGDKPWKYIGAPADGDSVLAIGAVNAEGYIANFSSEGPSSDGDVKPNVCSQGQLAVFVGTDGNVAAGNGTSFAGPIMAGMAACLWQIHRDSLTNMQIFHAIEQSADRYHNPDNFYGYGIPNFAKAHLMLSRLNPSNIDRSQLFPAYPNPFIDQVQGLFYSSGNQHVLIRLVDGLGQEIQRFEGRAEAYSGVKFRFSGLQHLNEGYYVLHIEADSGEYHQKLVKLRD